MVTSVKDNTGRFAERPHYQPKELDRECEAIITKFLRDRYGSANFPVSTDDLEVLIEQHADLDMYADLESQYGPDVEGVTEFFIGKKPLVKVSKRLSENATLKNRLRTTMTHEFGHVHFHAYLWDLKFSDPALFSKFKSDNVIVCKRDGIVGSSKTDWMEWQAGYVCGAILMPASHIKNFAGQFFETHGIFGAINVSHPQMQSLIDAVAVAYDVSKDAARVRLSVLGLSTTGKYQESLFG